MKAIGGPAGRSGASTCAPRCCSAPSAPLFGVGLGRADRQRASCAFFGRRSSPSRRLRRRRQRSSPPASSSAWSGRRWRRWPRSAAAPGSRSARHCRTSGRLAARRLLERPLRRLGFLPRTRRSACAASRAGRGELATVVQIALAVGDAARAALARRRRDAHDRRGLGRHALRRDPEHRRGKQFDSAPSRWPDRHDAGRRAMRSRAC